MKNTNMAVAETILEQLGGGRFIAMTGARNFVGTDNALHFALPRKARDGSNKVRITLMPSDTYLIETFAVRGSTVKACSERDLIYADMLREAFTSITGLAVSL
jgi:hypothetical protein